MTPVPVLEARDVSVTFGGLKALDSVTVTVERGTIHGLMGPNGAGKSTFFDVVSGLLRPRSGEVLLEGRAGHAQAAAAPLRARLESDVPASAAVPHADGARAPHRRAPSPSPDDATRPVFAPDRDEDAAVDEVITLLHLNEVADVPAALLALGTARLVEIARALAGNPAVILLDEPSSGLDSWRRGRWQPHSTGHATSSDIALLLVEHDVELLMELCDHIDVLDFGRLIAAGPPDAVHEDPAVTAAYLGVTT